MLHRFIVATAAALSFAASAVAADGYYDAWGNWIDTTYYGDTSGLEMGGYHDAWGNWIDPNLASADQHARNMDQIAAYGAASTANYLARDAASDLRQQQALEAIWQ